VEVRRKEIEMLTPAASLRREEKGGTERRRGVRCSNQKSALFAVPITRPCEREEHLWCRPNMHDKGKLNVCGGNKLSVVRRKPETL
jgi:hypothetical protein